MQRFLFILLLGDLLLDHLFNEQYRKMLIK